MATVFVSGLINIETSVKVAQFPIEYFPIDFPFFGVNTAVSGVGYNVAKALDTLGDQVKLAGMLGKDIQAEVVLEQLRRDGLDTSRININLLETPSSVILYDKQGKREIYCDLKDIQDKCLVCTQEEIEDCDIVAACNINFNRTLLKKAVNLHKLIATDVHVLSDIEDSYSKEFMEAANLLFLSDEKLPCEPKEFLFQLENRYQNDIIVIGRGNQGAMMYVKKEAACYELPCIPVSQVINTVGAGDALFSAFLHFYCKGMEPVECLWHAQAFASAKIQANGGAQGFISEQETMQRRIQYSSK